MRRLIFLFVLILAVGVVTKAADATFKAPAPQTVVMGEQFRLTFTVNAEGRDLRVQEMPDFDVLMDPSQSTSYSSSWVDGKSIGETAVAYTYILMPKKKGTFSIALATIKVNGSNYTSNGSAIKVLPADRAGKQEAETTTASGTISNDRLFVRMDVSERSVFEQEGFLMTFKVYSLENFSITGSRYPEFEGFLVQEVELPRKRQLTSENYNGRNCQSTAVRQAILYLQRSGKITIESGECDAVVRIRIQQAGGGSIFGSFFDSYRDVNKVLTTSLVTIDMKPLPSGKPAFFPSAVGTFSMMADTSSNNVKTDEAVTMKVEIVGNGSVKLVKSPEVVFPNDFDVYDPKIEMDIKTTTVGVGGSKTIEYMAIPRYTGNFEIPAIAFSYFGIKSGPYKTIKSEPYELHVEQSKDSSGSSPVVSNFSNKESVKCLDKDIRYLKTKDFSFIEGGDGISFGSFMCHLCYIIPTILFIVFFFIYRKQVRENADIALVRTKKTNKMAVGRLKDADKLMKENKEEKFYGEVLRALWGYLNDKPNIPQPDLTKDNVKIELAGYGVDGSLTNEFMDILNTCEFACYAPSQASDAMDKLYKLTVDTIGRMENTAKK